MGRAKKREKLKPKNIEAIDTELKKAQDRLRRLVADNDDRSSAAQARALQAQRVWDLIALRCQRLGHVAEAAKASAQAVAAGKLADRLAKAGLVDRVAELERRIEEQSRAGARLRSLAERTKQCGPSSSPAKTKLSS